MYEYSRMKIRFREMPHGAGAFFLSGQWLPEIAVKWRVEGGVEKAPRTTFTPAGNLLHQRIGIFGLCVHKHTHSAGG